MCTSINNDADPIIRVWGGHRESGWNEFWTMDGLLRQKPALAAAFRACGVKEVDLCPALRLRAPVSPHDVEVFLPNLTSPPLAQLVCDEVHRITGRRPIPMVAQADDAFRSIVSERQLYLRQGFELWDEVLPRFLLGVDFDSGRHVRLRPKEPEKWRLVDHWIEGGLGRHVIPSFLLEASAKGTRLLTDLKTELDHWYKYDFRGRPHLNAILDYRRILQRYGVDCNEMFRYGLADGWFPIDAEEDQDWNAVRELCATPLPDNAGDLLLDENNKPVAKYGAIFYFIAVTDNSTDVGQVPDH
jgi:hypothetical protein